MRDAALEFGQGRTQRKLAGDTSEHAGLTGGDDQQVRRAAAYAGAHEGAVAAFSQPGLGHDHPRHLGDRERLAGQHRLTDKEILGFQQHAIGRDQTAGREQHHVARHDRRRQQLEGLAVTQHLRVEGDLRAQLLDGVARHVFLHEAQYGAAEHDHQYHAGIDPLAGDE